MDIPTPRTWAYRETLTSTKLAEVRDDLAFLLGPPKSFAWRSGSWSLSNGTWTVCTLDTEAFDTDNMWSSTTNPTRLTVTTPGTYLIMYSMRFTNNGNGIRALHVRLNGNYIMVEYANGQASYDTTIRNAFPYPLVAGDYLELWGYQNSGGSLAVRVDYAWYTGLQALWIGK